MRIQLNKYIRQLLIPKNKKPNHLSMIGRIALSLVMFGMMALSTMSRDPFQVEQLRVNQSTITRAEILSVGVPNSSKLLQFPMAQVLVASWYGQQFAGKLMANGQVFNPQSLVAASKTLPFGTKLKLLNPANKRVILVTVTDRGPFICGRDLDVSEGAAIKLGFRQKGVTQLIVISSNYLAPQAAADSTAECRNSNPRKVRRKASPLYATTNNRPTSSAKAVLSLHKPKYEVTNAVVITLGKQSPEVLQLQVAFSTSGSGRLIAFGRVSERKIRLLNHPRPKMSHRIKLDLNRPDIRPFAETPNLIVTDIGYREFIEARGLGKPRKEAFQMGSIIPEGTAAIESQQP